MFIKKIGNNYYVCRYVKSGRPSVKHPRKVKLYDWYLIKNCIIRKYIYGIIDNGSGHRITFPKEVIGKRVRLKVEVMKMEDKEKSKRYIKMITKYYDVNFK